jgi:flagellar protein FlgJ
MNGIRLVSLDKHVVTSSTSRSVDTDLNKLREAAQEFEAVFIKMLLSQMRATVPNDGFLGESSQGSFLQEQLFDELSRSASKAGGIGLAEIIYKDLQRICSLQEK